MKRDETRWEYSTNLREKLLGRTSGSRGYMMETRGSEKKSVQTVDKGAEILVTPRMEDRLVITYCKTTVCSFIVHTRGRIGLGTAKTGKRLLSYSGAC